MRHMKTVLDDLRVTYNLPVQPVHLQMRGGPSPFQGRQSLSGKPETGNLQKRSDSINKRFLSPDSLGNGARIGGGSAFSVDTIAGRMAYNTA